MHIEYTNKVCYKSCNLCAHKYIIKAWSLVFCTIMNYLVCLVTYSFALL